MELKIFMLILLLSLTRQEALNNKCSEGETSECNSSAEINANYDAVEVNTLSEYDCSLVDFENEQNLITLRGMLKKGEEEIIKQNDNSTSTILVLGNAGAGKTTFVQFMAGDNNKLMSKETRLNSGIFTIEDGIKIGASLTESFTEYPESLKFTTNASLTDTPGFKDTRSTNHEIVESYLMKKFLKNVKNIKIVLIITYYSVEQGAYKDDFINLMRNLNQFLKNLDKYKQSITLIATKVPNRFITANNSVSLVSNEEVMLDIVEYLMIVQQSLQEKLKDITEVNEKQFLQNANRIIQSLLEKDSQSNYKRINIFRRPFESGPLSQIETFQKEKESLKKTIENVIYQDITEDNIGYTLSDGAKNYLNCLSWYINEKILKMSFDIFQLIEKHYELKIKNYTDIYTLNSELEEILKKLKLFKSDLKSSKNFETYMTRLNKFIKNENIHLEEAENTTVLDFELHEYVNSLQQFTNTSKILSVLSWSEQMKDLISYIKENQIWYKFLIKSFEYASSYKVQNLKLKYLNENSSTEIYDDPMKIIFPKFDWSDKNSNTYFNILTNEKRTSELNSILSFTFKERNNVTCDKNGKLIIKGFYIAFSVINTEFLKFHCKDIQITFIGMYAIHTVFIDADFNDEIFRGINIMIASPKWEIIGDRIINIDGKDGIPHNNSVAEHGQFYGDVGKNGLPGLPGGSGGNFLGIGLHFINENHLTVSLSGGKGGPGQTGGNGYKGEDGKNGYEKFYDNIPNDLNYDEKWTYGMNKFPFINKDWELNNNVVNESLTVRYCQNEVFVYTQSGECGKMGSSGGNGGIGGIGGYAGNFLLIGERESPKFLVRNSSRISGDTGIDGTVGKQGKDGKSSMCFKMYMRDTNYGHEKRGWICKDFFKEALHCETSYTHLLTNHSTQAIQKPNEIQVDYSPDLYNYNSYLKENENNKFLVKSIKEMQHLIYSKLYSMRNLFWRFIFIQETTPNSNQNN